MVRRSYGSSVVAALAAAVLALVAVGCGSSGSPSTRASSGGASGPLTVFAAASLTESFDTTKAALEAADDGLSITTSYAGSGALVQQILQGAPADVVATADLASMQKLVDAGVVDTPVTFARNKLEILVQPGNPKAITSIVDLARDDVVFVTEDESVPAGRYTAAMLAAAGVQTHPVSKEADVRSAVAKVTSGDADAAVVYVTDVKAAGSKGTGVAIPDAQNQVAVYPIAVVRATAHRQAALAFVDAVTNGPGRVALQAAGFLPAR